MKPALFLRFDNNPLQVRHNDAPFSQQYQACRELFPYHKDEYFQQEMMQLLSFP